MNALIFFMIILGVIIMVTNIYRYYRLIIGSSDVLSSSRTNDRMWENIALLLLIFFLLGYILVAAYGKPDIIIACILFGGSVFVSIVLSVMNRLVNTIKVNALSIAEALIGVVDARDPNLKGHSHYVKNIAMVFYDYIPPEKRGSLNKISLEFAALMHDVGKLGIPEEILNKPSSLTADEWEIMRKHPSLGVQIMKPLNSLNEILPWIEYHHEKIDGTGYYKKTADEIPYPAKILAIADTYSAITMRRSYKPPRSYEEAAGIMKEVAGTQLDKELVDIFLSIPKEELEKCIPEDVDA